MKAPCEHWSVTAWTAVYLGLLAYALVALCLGGA